MSAVTTARQARGEQQRREFDRRFWYVVGGFTLLGLLWRITYATLTPHMFHFTDEWWFVYNARGTFSNLPFIDPYAHSASAKHGPLEVFILTPFAYLWPHATDGLRYVNATLGAGTIVAMGVVGRQLGGRRVGMLAAALAALLPNVWAADGVATNETAGMLLAVVALGLAVRLLEGWTWKLAGLLGLALGLFMLARSEMPLIGTLLVGGLILRSIRSQGWRAGLRASAPAMLTVVVAAAVVLPWAGYNATRFGGKLVVTNNLGETLSAGNCQSTYYPNSSLGRNQTFGYYNFICAIGAKNKETAKGVTREDLVDAGQAKQAIDYAKTHWKRLPMIAGLREMWGWSLWRPAYVAHALVDNGRPSWATWGQIVGIWLLLPLAAAGAWLRRRSGQVVWPLLGLVAVAAINIAIFIPSYRYRLVAIPALVLLASTALVAAYERWVRPAAETPSTAS